MKILISGASGLVGSELKKQIEAKGYKWAALTTQIEKLDDKHFYWNVEEKRIEKSKMEGFDAIVHLAGEGIADGRWDETKKQKIKDSRIDGTKLLVETIRELKNKPKVFVSASAIGFYGDRPDQTLTESSSPLPGNFLSDVCQEWEEASTAITSLKIRRVILRTGIVLSKQGGALKQMLLPFQMGAGGILGNGKQYMSWIDLTDMAAMYLHACEYKSMSGVYNATAPEPATNKVYTKTLGSVIGRPTLIPVPTFGLKLLFGEMADALLLSDLKVIPQETQKTNFKYQYPNLEESLKHQIK